MSTIETCMHALYVVCIRHMLFLSNLSGLWLRLHRIYHAVKFWYNASKHADSMYGLIK